MRRFGRDRKSVAVPGTHKSVRALTFAVPLLLAAAGLVLPGTALALEAGYVLGAPPFSMSDARTGKASGYAVSLCEQVAADMGEPIGFRGLSLAEGLAAVEAGEIDLLCGPVTETLARRETLDFSIPIFFGGAGLMMRGDASIALQTLVELPDNVRPSAALMDETAPERSVAVIAGGTTEELVVAANEARALGLAITPVATHEEGMALLEAGTVSLYAAERGVLFKLWLDQPDARAFKLVNRRLSTEPLALVMSRERPDLRLAADQALSRLYRGDGFYTLLNRTFGGKGGDVLFQLREVALPE